MPEPRFIGSCHFIYQRPPGIGSNVHGNKKKDSKQSSLLLVGIERADIGDTRRWNNSSGVGAGRSNLLGRCLYEDGYVL